MVNDIELLKNSRKALGLSQNKLASRLGVARITVAQWETGARSPSPEVFKKLLAMIVELKLINNDRMSFIESTVKKLR